MDLEDIPTINILFLRTRAYDKSSNWDYRTEKTVQFFDLAYGLETQFWEVNKYFHFSLGVLTVMNQDEIKIWKDHQESITPAIKEMSNDQLDDFITSLETTIFEAKAKHQRAYQEKKERDIKARGGILPPINRTNGSAETPIQRAKKEEKAKKGKAARLADAMELFGLDAGETLKEYKKESFQKMEQKQEAITQAKREEKKVELLKKPVINGEECGFSPSGVHEITNSVCSWCGDRETLPGEVAGDLT